LLSFSASFIVFAADGGEQPELESIKIKDLPSVVMEAAQDTLPGITITMASFEETEDGKIYYLIGELDDVVYDLSIDEWGYILDVSESGIKEEESEEDEG
jgi:hypothetical protein